MRTILEDTVARTVKGWSSVSRIKGLRRALGGFLLLALLHTPFQAVHAVGLAWDPSPDPNVVGYALYYGTNSGSYQTRLDVGNHTNATIQIPTNGSSFFFVATAYTFDGVESLPSNEVSYTATVGLPTVRLRITPTRQFILTVTGQVGRTYNIQASPDLVAWTVIGAMVLPPGGSLDFTDTNAASFPRRFYRTQ
jgi:hypothetical protein